MTTTNHPVDRLLEILTYKRRASSVSELDFIDNFIMPYNPQVLMDTKGVPQAYYLTTDASSKTLFCAHTDTCHKTAGVQEIIYDPHCNLVYKVTGKTGDDECLGADDGAGIAILLDMIDAHVPGHYIFFRFEEVGGTGSRWAAEAHAEFFRQMDRAVAFDRRGVADVITYQAMGRCCSDEFADTLANELNLSHKELDYKSSDGGIFTDTANLTHLIPECTNVSVGYDMEHHPEETLDVDHWQSLRTACLTIDWESLPTKRDPADIEPWPSYNKWGRDYYNDQTDTFAGMTYKQLLAWVRKSSAEDIADAMSDMVDRLLAAEDAAYYNSATFSDPPTIDDESFPGEWHQ